MAHLGVVWESLQTELSVDILTETDPSTDPLQAERTGYVTLVTSASRTMLLNSQRRSGMIQLAVVWESLQTEVPADLLIETGDTTDPVEAERAGYAFLLTAPPRNVSYTIRRE